MLKKNIRIRYKKSFTAPDKFPNAAITGHFGFVFEENSGRKPNDYRGAVVFKQLRFQNVFRSQQRVGCRRVG